MSSSSHSNDPTNQPWRIHALCLHPGCMESYSNFGVFRSAIDKGLLEFTTHNLRQYAIDRHGTVDGRPFGGGDGMVLRPEPLARAIQDLKQSASRPLHVIMPSPAGLSWQEKEVNRLAHSIASCRDLVFVCGRFAGIDQRFIDRYVDEEFSMGDFVVSGGELPALMMIDSMLRKRPGVLGHSESAAQDSFADIGHLEHPLYTRPNVFEGEQVPEALLSGDHSRITKWRVSQAQHRTEQRRPDLIKTQNKP